jgi:hypothetical protein
MLEKSFGIRTTLIFGLVTLVSKNLKALSAELHNEPSNSTNVVQKNWVPTRVSTIGQFVKLLQQQLIV